MDRETQKALILTIVGAILFVVPFVGEAGAAAAGAAGMACTMLMASEAANFAFRVYSVADDPSSALVEVIAMLMGVGSIAKAG